MVNDRYHIVLNADDVKLVNEMAAISMPDGIGGKQKMCKLIFRAALECLKTEGKGKVTFPVRFQLAKN